MKRFAAIYLLTMVLMSTVDLRAQVPVSFATELERLSNLQLLPRYMEGTVVKQVSSYDTTGGNDDGFGGKYSYLRKEAGGLVIFDHEGQGVIERIWTPTPTDDTLDFYFDGDTRPGLSIRFRDLFNGTVAPFLKPLADHKVGGFYSYIPIPYQKGCKIVFRGKKILFHQIQYRTYDGLYKVRTFKKEDAGRERQRLQKAVALWADPDRDVRNFYPAAPAVITKKLLLRPGSSAVVAALQQGGRILGLELKPAAAFNGIWKQLDLKITWDDEPGPAVWVPVADFFGFAYGSRSMESLFLGATGAKVYSYIPMPFDRKAKIELVYRNGYKDLQPVELFATVSYTYEKRNAAKEGRFYALWKNEHPPLGAPYVFLEGQGKGHYIGTLLQGQATDFTNFTEFFEGDDATTIDGSMTLHGTGSEDYFNGGWYAQPGGWVERLGAPLSGCLDYSLPLGRTGGYRFFLTDKMPFRKSILHTIEHGPVRNNRLVQYTSVALYYATGPIARSVAPDNERTRVWVPDTVTFYTRLMRHLTYNGNLQLQQGAAALTGKDNAVLNINVSEVPRGKYRIFLHQVKAATNQLEVRIADAVRVQDWRSVAVIGGNQPVSLLIGEVEITDASIPVSVLFRSGDPQPGLVFDRVMFAKEK
ncbi:glycoside hydrolase family 172 protein [Niabella aurantiaca]|uniref:glycoside hydrolase family 172 protein n=1 Tax=Niabella aurantiaca TaxID=379900 RepID=UPI0003720E0C|nr:glycoside hydrolase family 172 protein [Niabella aurantiaca]